MSWMSSFGNAGGQCGGTPQLPGITPAPPSRPAIPPGPPLPGVGGRPLPTGGILGGIGKMLGQPGGLQPGGAAPAPMGGLSGGLSGLLGRLAQRRQPPQDNSGGSDSSPSQTAAY